MTRTFTPDRENADGSTTIKLKRACNGCGQLLGDVDNRDVDANGNLTDVRGECDFCRPVVELERQGCRTWYLTPRNITSVDRVVDQDRIYAKGYWQTVDGTLQVVGIRIGHGGTRIVGKFGDWIIRHPNGKWAVHKAVAA